MFGSTEIERFYCAVRTESTTIFQVNLNLYIAEVRIRSQAGSFETCFGQSGIGTGCTPSTSVFLVSTISPFHHFTVLSFTTCCSYQTDGREKPKIPLQKKKRKSREKKGKKKSRLSRKSRSVGWKSNFTRSSKGLHWIHFNLAIGSYSCRKWKTANVPKY